MNNRNIIPLIVYPTNNGYVSNLKPTIQGTGEPGATINGTIDNTAFAANIIDTGEWSYTLTNDLKDNTSYMISVTQISINGQTSSATSVEFKADTNALVPHTVTSPAANQFINTNTPIISGNGKAGATIESNISGSICSTVVNQDGYWEIKTKETLTEGIHKLDVVQKDERNTSPAITLYFTVDTLIPAEPEIEVPSNMGYEKTPTPVVSGRGEAGATISAMVDDKEYLVTADKSGTWNFEVSQELANDIHIISAKQKDPAGNISHEKIILFSVDTLQPAAPYILSPTNGANLRETSPIIKGSGEKGNRVEIRLDNKIYSTVIDTQGKWEIHLNDQLSDGAYTFRVYQISKAGNVSPYATLTIKIDTTVPLAPVILYPLNNSYINSIDFAIKGTGEPEATIECNVAGKKYTTKVEDSGSWSMQISHEDNRNFMNMLQYTIAAVQIDRAGNTSPVVKLKFKIDTEILKAPEITYPTNSASINLLNPTITGKGKVGATINLRTSQGYYTSYVTNDGSWSATIGQSLLQGSNAITVYQTDSGNTSAESTVSFFVDTIAPSAPQINFPAENQNVDNTNLIVRGNGEADANINLMLDDLAYTGKVKADNTWEVSIPETLANGLHTIMASQTDVAGNVSTFSTINFSTSSAQNSSSNASDGQPISYEIKYNPPGPNWTAKTIVTLKTSRPVTINNVNGSVFSKVVTTNGISTFNYTDQQGHKGSATAGVSWIDNTPPIITVDSNCNYFSSDKTVNYFKTHGSGIKYALLNGEPFESGRVVTADGLYKVEVSDQISNITTEEFIIDKTSPTISGVENGKVYNADVNISYSDNLSGIKSALLNGQNLSSGTTLTQNGNYTVAVTDYGDNINEMNFQIQK